MCMFCKGGKLVPNVTEYVEKSGNMIIVVKNVPCEKCDQCGETYFSMDVSESLFKILDEIKMIASEITLTVIDYNNKVA